MEKRPWWQHEAVIAWAMILLFPLGLILMWLYAPWRPKFKWAWTAVFGVVMLLVIIGSATGGGDKKEEVRASVEPTTEAAPTKAPPTEAIPTNTPQQPPTVSPTKTSEPSWSSGAALSEANVRSALDNADGVGSSLDLSKPVSVVIDGGVVTVTYKAGTAWSETDLLTIGAYTSFSAARALFENPLVETVTVTMLADWTDQYGKTAEEVTTVSTLDRATANKIDWAGLEDRVTLDNKHFFCISDNYRIHLAIYSRLKDKGCLTGAVR